MILTVTCNPSMDSIYIVDDFSAGKLTRFSNPTKMPGGKGINLGRTSSTLGSHVLLTGYLGGSNGMLIANMLKSEGLFVTDFLHIEEENRHAITIMHNNGEHTELVEAGPFITKQDEDCLFNHIKTICLSNPSIRVICISGSVNSDNPAFYSNLLEFIYTNINSSIKVLMDLSGIHLETLLKSDSYKPYFIKPNIHELSDLFKIDLEEKKDVLKFINSSLFKDIPVLMISCGKQGAIVRYNDTIYDLEVPNVHVVNTTGSGDATVGGIAHSINNNFSVLNTIRVGMACGISNALHQGVGVIDPAEVEYLMKEVVVKEL